MAESHHHIALKELIRTTAIAEGWTATLEVSGVSPTGKRWRADVVATNGDRKVAVEVQWSGQPHASFVDRAAPYREAGMEVVWLHRSERLSVDEAVVEAKVSHDKDQGYLALLRGSWNQTLPVDEFVRAILTNRLIFRLPEFPVAMVAVHVADAQCWEPTCDGAYPVLPIISFSFGHPRYPASGPDIGLDEIGEIPAVEARLREELKDHPVAALLKHRYSHTAGHSYLSSGCPKCDRIAGQFFMHDYWYDAVPLKSFTMPTFPELIEKLFEDGDMPEGWVVV
jgi:hypothetical protein